MLPETNPYQAPPEASDGSLDATERGGTTPVRRPERVIWFYVFVLGIVLAVCGAIAILMPNTPPIGLFLFAITMFFLSAVFSRKYRGRSIVGIAACLMVATGAIYHLRHAHAQQLRQRAIVQERLARSEEVREYEREMAKQTARQAKQAAGEVDAAP